mgnify:CR=1 FL=1
MARKEVRRVFRSSRVSQGEAERLRDIRRCAMVEFPPDPKRPHPAKSGIGAQIRSAREARGLTWYAVAKLAGIPNPATIRDIEYGDQETYSIVGSTEVDPTDGRISHRSPIGRALMGHRTGDQVLVQAPGGRIEYEIVKIA